MSNPLGKALGGLVGLGGQLAVSGSTNNEGLSNVNATSQQQAAYNHNILQEHKWHLATASDDEILQEYTKRFTALGKAMSEDK
jgi:hypothetical protein